MPRSVDVEMMLKHMHWDMKLRLEVGYSDEDNMRWLKKTTEQVLRSYAYWMRYGKRTEVDFLPRDKPLVDDGVLAE